MSAPTRGLWLTSATAPVDHAVLDVDHERGIAAGNGLFLALCGQEFLVAAMISPPGHRCPACCAVLDARHRDQPRRPAGSSPRRRLRVGPARVPPEPPGRQGRVPPNALPPGSLGAAVEPAPRPA